MKRQSELVGPLVRRPLLEPDHDFTPDQLRVIAHRNSPLVVLGGPGTGKTTLIIESALSRINQGQDPNSILMLTYGRERASELRDAVALRTTAIMHEPIARTFHSLAFSILKMKAHSQDPDPILMSGPEQEFFIRDLLDGDIDLGKTYWPVDLEKALTTHGFVRELRDLILRASERNLSPDQLLQMGREHGEKYWEPAAIFWKQYLQVMDLQAVSAADAKRRIDPSQIVVESFHHLKGNPSLSDELRSRFTTVIVDEFQESDPAQRSLLHEISGRDTLIFADGDSAVGRFRGADPDQLEVELERYRSSGEEIVLREAFRSTRAIFEVGLAVAGEFRRPAEQRERRCTNETTIADAVKVRRFRSQSEEAQFIAYQFRHAHLIGGLPWSQMAVILRSPGSQASALRRAFSQSGVPVASDIEALSNNAAIAPFLLLAQIALGMKNLNADICNRLLLSEFGGADAVSLRRIRRALILKRSEDDARTGAELLIAAIDKGEINIDGAKPLEQVHALLAKARKILRRSNAQGEDLLWEIWSHAMTRDGSSLSESWRVQALKGGSRGAAADRDLDAMMQLFEGARRFAERFPHSSAESFIRQISQENILGDVITAQGQRPDVVEIMTVHSSKGREWEIVAVAGLQEGAWPNLRQRGSLLGSERLVERCRYGAMARKELDALAASGLVEDERRLLHVAVTRAKSELIVTAVQKDDDEPSSFFDELAAHVQISGATTAVPRPITPSALVATLRNELNGTRGDLAASLLRRIADEGLPEADVDAWAGVARISSTAPAVSEGSKVSVSPSSAEGFRDCGVKWFLERSGGTNGDSTAQVLGSAIHAFAALMEVQPELTEEDLVATLRDSWKLIDPNSGWVSAAQLNRAVEMIHNFVKYHTEALQSREILGVEVEFKVDLGPATIRGSIDRLDVSADGELFVVDFKTGSKAISIAEATENLQMQAYQLAIVEGGFTDKHPSKTSAGAELVYLASKTKDVTTRFQGPINANDVKEEILEIAEAMGKSHFIATINQRCDQCEVRSVCPIQPEGLTVVE